MESIEEKANKHVDLNYPMGVERAYPIEDFTFGYKECVKDLTEFLQVNPKANTQQVIEYLIGL